MNQSPLVGMFIHTFGDNGRIAYQGRIKSVHDAIVFVQLFSALTGDPTNIEVFELDFILGRAASKITFESMGETRHHVRCKLYENERDWLIGYTHYIDVVNPGIGQRMREDMERREERERAKTNPPREPRVDRPLSPNDRKAHSIIQAVLLDKDFTHTDLDWLEKHSSTLAYVKDCAELTRRLRKWGVLYENTMKVVAEVVSDLVNMQSHGGYRGDWPEHVRWLYGRINNLRAAVGLSPMPPCDICEGTGYIDDTLSPNSKCPACRKRPDPLHDPAGPTEADAEAAQLARDAAYAAELQAQQKAAPKHKAKAAAEMNVALETLLEKVDTDGATSSHGTEPTGNTDDAAASG